MKHVNLIKQIISSDTARVAEYSIAPRGKGHRHLHTNVFEQLYCLSGQLRVEVADQEDALLQTGESVVIPAGKFHCTHNLSDELSRFMVIQGDGSFDIVRE
jgi:quercetin dioxygenase-like cupin family protein